ncbi:hypothetical protein MMC30_005436 [Trapelia coarctata]|nr:hypothetical protein [Trapelia coarctata]
MQKDQENRHTGDAGGSLAQRREMHPAVKPPGMTSLSLEPPSTGPKPTVESDHSELERDEYDMQEGDVQTVVGVCMSREVTRLLSPTISAAEKRAVMDGLADWDGYYESGDEDQEESPTDVLRYPRRDSKPDTPPYHREQSPQAAKLALPTPWTATPKSFEVQDMQKKSGRKSPNVRSRASTGPTGMLADLSIKRFLASFSFPNLSEQQFFKDISMLKLPSMLASSKETEDGQQTSGRAARSNSLFAPSFSWTGSNQNDRSPRTREPSPNPSVRSDRTPSGTIEPIRPQGSQGDIPRLRRAASQQSLPYSTLSRISSLGDDSRWDHVHGQVNSRMKALKDTLQDSSIKLPSLPSINFSALRPEFTHKRSVSGPKNQVTSEETLVDSTSGNSDAANGATQSSSPQSAAKPSKKSSKSSYPHLQDALDNLTGDVVILGGYRGSILRSADPPYRQLWVPFKVGLNVRKVNLEVGLEPEDEENMESQIFASGMLSHIGPVDISRRLIRKLRNCRSSQEGRLRVHDFGYDWRLSPHLLCRKLLTFLKGLKCNQPDTLMQERGATIIAHSLGGLITRYVVNQRPTLFAGIVYAGVPQHCVNILGPLRNGDDVLLSSKVLTAQVNFTLRTSYALLPESGQCFIDKHTGERYDVDFFDVETWKKYAFSPCIAAPLPTLGPPERKGLLSSVSLNPRKLSGAITPPKSPFATAAEKTAQTVSDVANPDLHNLDMQMNASQPKTSSKPLQTSTIPKPLAIAYLRRTLAEILAFKQALVFQEVHARENTYPPLAVLYGASVPTVKGARVVGREGIGRADAYDNLAFASGDGVVLAKAAMLPRGYMVCEGGRVRTERGHVGLLGDLEAVGRCLGAVARGRARGVGLGRKMED